MFLTCTDIIAALKLTTFMQSYIFYDINAEYNVTATTHTKLLIKVNAYDQLHLQLDYRQFRTEGVIYSLQKENELQQIKRGDQEREKEKTVRNKMEVGNLPLRLKFGPTRQIKENLQTSTLENILRCVDVSSRSL